jgi:hypothetical protein
VERLWGWTLTVSPTGNDQCSWFSLFGSLSVWLHVERRIRNSHMISAHGRRHGASAEEEGDVVRVEVGGGGKTRKAGSDDDEDA